LAERAGFAHEHHLLQRPLKHVTQPLRFKWFGQVVVGADLNRLYGGIDGGLTGDKDDRDLTHAIAERGDEF
jgi:hypothetical protein